jgi:hypothetical protein
MTDRSITRALLACLPIALAMLTVAAAPRTVAAQRASDRNPHVPEPLLFDLVRGLGAQKGELEVNALVVHDFRAGRDKFYWNPEVEWIVADGIGLELELAMDRGVVESTKLMTQITFGTPVPDRYIHGAQIIGERSGIDDGYDLSVVYIGAQRFSPEWSLNFIQGAKYGAGIEDRQTPYWSWLGNATVFRETRRATFGLEFNVESPRSEAPTIRLTPQIHLSRGAWGVQAGLGVSNTGSTQETFAALRLVHTFRDGP